MALLGTLSAQKALPRVRDQNKGVAGVARRKEKQYVALRARAVNATSRDGILSGSLRARTLSFTPARRTEIASYLITDE